MWARASIRDGVATLRFAMDSYSARQIAMLVVTTIASWPGIDRRDVTRWYQYLSGGPAEGVLLEIAGMRDHELYVNSRYPNLDPSAVNDTATAILEHFGVRMSLGHIRGDALLMRAAGSRYPKPIEQGLVDQLCG
ncbi:hypothetical protein [Cellulomonas fimi]|uniref:Uncharacterized protein n=1 Tax=Cellulomonas fimi TaxID=1708 RepID=A0A7Y0QIA1_CELFI|nr:hypothetical protein [Cellulomonas fimi]NMR20973.1 hypothetical protein [Cellulomonas fimi]